MAAVVKNSIIQYTQASALGPSPALFVDAVTGPNPPPSPRRKFAACLGSFPSSFLQINPALRDLLFANREQVPHAEF